METIFHDNDTNFRNASQYSVHAGMPSSEFSGGRCWNGEGSGTQSGEPQSISIRTSSIWRIYASGVV